jgi:hypothetical protein
MRSVAMTIKTNHMGGTRREGSISKKLTAGRDWSGEFVTCRNGAPF